MTESLLLELRIHILSLKVHQAEEPLLETLKKKNKLWQHNTNPKWKIWAKKPANSNSKAIERQLAQDRTERPLAGASLAVFGDADALLLHQLSALYTIDGGQDWVRLESPVSCIVERKTLNTVKLMLLAGKRKGSLLSALPRDVLMMIARLVLLGVTPVPPTTVTSLKFSHDAYERRPPRDKVVAHFFNHWSEAGLRRILQMLQDTSVCLFLCDATNSSTLKDSIDLFDQLVNSPWLVNIPMTVFLCCADREVQIPPATFASVFPDCDANIPPEAQLEYLRNQFEAVKQSHYQRLYMHPRVVLDNLEQLKFVMRAVFEVMFSYCTPTTGLF